MPVNPPTPTQNPSTTPTARDVATEMFEIVQQVMRGSQAPIVGLVEQYDLSFAQLKLMFVLQTAADPLPIGRLAEITGASLPAAGRAVDGLVKHKLATRTEDPDDRRVKRIELTPLGLNAMDAIYETRIDSLKDIVAQLSGEELAELRAAIQPLRQVTRESSPNQNEEVSR